ncbi:MAG: hypothetical protein K8S25_11225 [Alphaproteobacteria bacterium]|nr:hypothetical protein [Alphaproteobacteria bacterium]
MFGYFRIAIAVLVVSVVPARAEEWLIVKDGATAWSFETSSVAKDPQTGFVHIHIGHYTSTPQSDGASHELRRYIADCARGQAKQISSKRYTRVGGTLAAGTQSGEWMPTSFGWPAKVKQFACDKTGLEKAVSRPTMIAALVGMVVTAGPAPAPASKPATPAATPAADKPTAASATASVPQDKLCIAIRKILGDGQKETPLFNSFYASAAERSKYAGLGSDAVEGFGPCNIQQNMTPPGRLSPVFGSYYCKKAGGSKDENAAFAAETSRKVSACLPTASLVETDDLGQSIKTYKHEVTMAGFPRVRVSHTQDGVTIYLDADKGVR